MLKKMSLILCAALFANVAKADFVGLADVILDYQDGSGGSVYMGSLGTSASTHNYRQLTEEEALFALTDNPSYTSYLGLSQGASITLGFINENVIDGDGDDIFVSEFWPGDESAAIYVSTNSVDFTFLGNADSDGGITSFDLADIGFTSVVRAIKIIGLDSNGATPGFDLTYVKALNRETLAEGQTNDFEVLSQSASDVSSPMAISAFLLAGGLLSSRRKKLS